MICFYHNDADGKCAGLWVGELAKRASEDTPLHFVSMDYKDAFPIASINQNERVYIVDFSIEPEVMRELLKITKDVTWIDHHKTAIEKYKDFEYDIRGIRYDGIAGCMLTWCYLELMTNGGEGEIRPFDEAMTEYAPKFTKLIADWDVWKFRYGNFTRNFMMAFNAYVHGPCDPTWNYLLSSGEKACRDIASDGFIMMRYRDSFAKNYVSRFGFETEIDGHKAFAMNLGNCNSEFFKSLPEGVYDILAPFCFDGKVWTVSLYSKTVDVSEIAKKYGGGGHKCAAGFVTKEPPFHAK